METQRDSKILLVLTHCFDACNNMISAGKLDPQMSKLIKCNELCKDAAQICHTTSSFVSRNSYNTKRMLRFCSEMLHRTADELSKYPEFDQMKQCSEVCRACAEACVDAS